ncbi:DUF4332 domain-containing protein [Roseiconus nitratireducens]|uniref:DUF4332 domain-containing protein n=1 Tax=Roseiconus nitratireducens TaxID=2605748 RepID=A0A5M6DAS1_9BACT|nr:DUF4332 domain-containing protein [Roseiconus nitratireducens]KAA5543109.1 DUF4332 domain-containing protein [Roseiconus nitratireducens]
MLLDRIDIDHHGPLNRVELGPFSEHLNVVCTPEGAGKTAIARFVRDSLVRREYPLGMMSSSSGRVVWADRNGKIHCRREQDGTPTGRRTIEFETRGDAAHRFDWLHGSWIDGIADSTDASRALESIRIPESVVDGIVTDTAVTRVARVVEACLKSGLDDPKLYAGLPMGPSVVSGTSPDSPDQQQGMRRVVRDELARVEAELASLEASGLAGNATSPDEGWIETRRRQLQHRLGYLREELSRVRSGAWSATRPWTSQDRVVADELSRLHDRIWHLRVRRNELDRWLSQLEQDRHRVRYSTSSTASPPAQHHNADALNAFSTLPSAPGTFEMDARLRATLGTLEAQILRWRRVHDELRGLRQAITRLHPSIDAPTGSLPFSEEMLRRERMNRFLASLDRYNATASDGQTPWGAFEPILGTDPAWPDEVDLRIEAIVSHLDWLVSQYDAPGATWSQWYRAVPAAEAYRNQASLVRCLRTIQQDLLNVRRHGFRLQDRSQHGTRNHSPLWDVQQCEQWVVATIRRLIGYRQSLVADRRLADLVHYPSWLDESYERQNWSVWYIDHLESEAARRMHEIQKVSAELNHCLNAAAELHRRQRHTIGETSFSDPSFGMDAWQRPLAEFRSPVDLQAEIDAVRTELERLNQHHTDSPRVRWLRERRAKLIAKLGVPQTTRRSDSPLADEASQWLVRLSGGRLKRLRWSLNGTQPPANSAAKSDARQTWVQIDGVDEQLCPAVDRALAALALRLAAGDLLARTGRSIPLVVESHRELLRSGPADAASEHSWNATGNPPLNLSVIAALDDYAKQGRQVIVLTSDRLFADQAARRGGHTFSVHGERVAHAHRPLWRPHFAPESYVGPHAGAHVLDPAESVTDFSDAFVDQYYDSASTWDAHAQPSGMPPQSAADLYPPVGSGADDWQSVPGVPGVPASQQPFSALGPYDSLPQLPPAATFADINRNLDAIWQEIYGANPYAAAPAAVASARQPVRPAVPSGAVDSPDAASANGHWDDGYYFADSFTTVPRGSNAPRASEPNSQTDRPAEAPRKVSPFFLTVDSPIDQAPSVDGVSASRLRKLNVSHITHLMQQDPNRLADALGLASVNAATIRRWQAECRLVCHVPQLRAFDARVLVGSGITDAGQLSATDPMDLLDRVEAFLATERGQRILLSGTSYELSRITSWIATANVTTDGEPILRVRDHQTVDGRVVGDGKKSRLVSRDAESFEYEFVDDQGQVVRARSKRRKAANEAAVTRQASRSDRDASGQVRRRVHPDGRTRSSVPLRSQRSFEGTSRRDGASSSAVHRRSMEPHSQEHTFGTRRAPEQDLRHSDGGRESVGVPAADEGVEELRFYLQRESPIVDAPSIGSRMAEKLEAIEVHSVDDLLNSDPAELAELLDHRRIDADVVAAWQHQSILVCRIPMLRGHDAQLLVAAGITTPEEVAALDPKELLEVIDPIARSNEGKRILRGGKLPDLAEVTEWVTYAGMNRDLVAA